MKYTNNFQRLLKSVILVLVCLSGFSFTGFAGGDSYSIYLNKKLLFTRYVHSTQQVDIKTLQLSDANYNDELTIYYSHCGKNGQGRSIAIRDDQGKILKKWNFDDATPNGAMVIPVKEILALEKSKSISLANIYYFSSVELPKGMMLAPVKMGDAKTVVLETKESESNGNSGELFTFSALSLLFGAASLYRFNAK